MAIADAIALGLAVTSTIGGDEALAVDECGAPEPGGEIVCTPSDYDAAEDGNIFYDPDEWHGDFTLRLPDDLVVDYDRDNPGDDVYF